MSYKKDLKHKIESVLHQSSHQQTSFFQVLQEVFQQALDESKKTGQSISSITYEILEGIEESHHQHKEQVETQLSHASVMIGLIIYQSAQKSIEEKEKKLQQVQAQLIDTIELEILHLLESIETFESYAEDKSHRQFKQSLSKTKSDILDNINTFKTLLIQHSTS